MGQIQKIDGELLSRMMTGLLLYRLGGEQSFTMQEITDICEQVAGVQIALSPDGRVVVRVRNHDVTLKALEDGRAI